MIYDRDAVHGALRRSFGEPEITFVPGQTVAKVADSPPVTFRKWFGKELGDRYLGVMDLGGTDAPPANHGDRETIEKLRTALADMRAALHCVSGESSNSVVRADGGVKRGLFSEAWK